MIIVRGCPYRIAHESTKERELRELEHIYNLLRKLYHTRYTFPKPSKCVDQLLWDSGRTVYFALTSLNN